MSTHTLRPRSPRRLGRTAGAAVHATAPAWLSLLLAVAVMLVIFAAGASTALASTGRPEGFAVERASSQIVIGRATLRYEPALQDEAVALAQAMPSWWSELEVPLALDVDDTVHVTFVDHAGRVAEATGMPHWVAGVARPETGEIVIARHGPDGSPTDLERLLKHEMAHVILHRATGGAALPRWFHEGVAESMTGGISLARAQTLAGAVFGGGVPDMARLEALFHGEDGPDAAVAYAAARDLVEFLRAQPLATAARVRAEPGGSRVAVDPDASLRQLFAAMRQGQGFDDAFVRTYGAPLHELAARWRDGLPARFVWYPLLAGGGLPFVVVVPLLAMAWIRRRRLLRRGWERLAREDELERTAWTPAMLPAMVTARG
ncbi:MAG: hypothetical protein K1X88_00505 [Nannocystaceae bacterium]|nr:hypothetical protein [Nannocystaceae bacterium]